MVIHPNHLSSDYQLDHPQESTASYRSHSSRTASHEAAQVSISQIVWLSSLRNTLDNQYSSAEHYTFLSVYLYEHSVQHTLRSFRLQIRSPHGNANGYTSMETCLLFALYLLRIVGPLGQLWNALASAPRAMNELLNGGLSSRFFFFFPSFVYQVKT